jgi:hypothetical protein
LEHVAGEVDERRCLAVSFDPLTITGAWACTYTDGEHGLRVDLISSLGRRGEVLPGNLEQDKHSVEDQKDCSSVPAAQTSEYSPASMDLGRMGDKRWPSGKYLALRCTDLYRPAVRRMVAIWYR